MSRTVTTAHRPHGRETTDGSVVANPSYDDIERFEPVFHDDTFRARSTVTDRAKTNDGDRRAATMDAEMFRTNDPERPPVYSFSRTVLSPKRSSVDD